MIFRQLFDTTSSTYTYLLADAVTREAVLIDPVFELHNRDVAMLREMGLKLVYTLDTHAHADHVTGAWLLKRALGSKIVLSSRYAAQEVDQPVDHGDLIRFGERALEIRATPGHTEGCITFVTPEQDLVFTGDCLLIRGAGRTDFQQGSASTLYRSIKNQIFSLPGDCMVFPAHDYSGRTTSTVEEEKRFNPRIGGNSSELDFVGYMENLGLPHPKKIDLAVPANMRCGRPDDELDLRPATWGPVIVNYAGILTISAEWVYQHLDEVHLLDVREEFELKRHGKLANSQLIPLGELRNRIADVPTDKPVVTICHAGSRSGQATVILRKAGVSRVANLEGGTVRWHELSYPMV